MPTDELRRRLAGKHLVASSGSGQHNSLAGFNGDVASEELIRQENNLFRIETTNDGRRIAGSTADIDLSLHIGVGVDVTNYWHIGEFAPNAADVLRRNAGCQRTAALPRRQENCFLRAENFSPSRP